MLLINPNYGMCDFVIEFCCNGISVLCKVGGINPLRLDLLHE